MRSAGLFELLDTVFPGVRDGAAALERLGAAWESVSTPFVHCEAGRPVAHVGLLELPLVVRGHALTVGAVHAVATHPEHRRRGHYRRVMQAALRHAAGRCETLVLTTEHPEYFEPFGFRWVREHGFTVHRTVRGTSGGGRDLRLQDPADLALLHRLLETREPVSQLVGVRREKAVFLFNEWRRPLFYVPDLDVVVCLEVHGRQLRLFDVVGPHVPALAALLERLPHAVDEILVGFAPDRLATQAAAVPWVFDHDGPSYLMVRGPFAAESEPFTLPRSART